MERFVPHEQILPHVAAVVTHGGAGMVGRAFRHGVPMLMIPLFAEQPLNAQLAEAQGLGFYHLPFSQATPEAIRERLRALLEDRGTACSAEAGGRGDSRAVLKGRGHGGPRTAGARDRGAQGGGGLGGPGFRRLSAPQRYLDACSSYIVA